MGYANTHVCLKPGAPASNRRFDLGPYAGPLCDSAAIWTIPGALHVSSHASDTFEIDYVHRGSLTFHLPGQAPMRIHGGDVSILQPRTEHSCEHDTMAHCSYVVLCVKATPPNHCPPFADEELPAILRLLRDNGNRVVRACDEMDTVFLELRNVSLSPPEQRCALWYNGWLRNLVHRLFLCIVRSLATSVRAPHYQSIEQAKRLIEQSLTSPTRVAQIAREVGLSSPRLASLFQSATGQTPADYRMRLRVEAAARELRDPSRSITNVAAQYCFASSQHFSLCFKRYLGVTPTAWRKLPPQTGTGLVQVLHAPSSTQRCR